MCEGVEHEFSNPPKDRGVFAGVELRFSCVSENTLGECNDVCGYNENQVMGMFEKAEQEYQDVMEKKRIVENDKRKIEMVMHELDEKKNQALKTTWTKVCVCARARERVRVCTGSTRRYGVATTSRLLKIISLFCRISSLL